MPKLKRSVLITGCSDGGMGSALAKEFHQAGYHVYATARNEAKMSTLKPLGIEIMPLDITSTASIHTCVNRIPALDILVNNAGAHYPMPISDLPLSAAREFFETNLWGHIAMIQAFLPHLRESSQRPIIVNHTSTGAGISIPFQAAYNASKAALVRFSDTLRLELRPFGISVVDLRTAGVKTNVVTNARAKRGYVLPNDSMYAPARERVEETLTLAWSEAWLKVTAEEWARDVVSELTKNGKSRVIWKGEGAFMAWLGGFFPGSWFDPVASRLTGLNEIERILQK